MTLLVATFLVFPFTFLESGLNLNHSSEVLFSVFLLGFLCTGMAYMGYVVLIKRVGPVKASTVVLIVPVSGMLWANLFLDEAITSTMLVGCLLIITGVGLVNFFKDETAS
jgi:drug/metabolite transporter (DMT)-like permease